MGLPLFYRAVQGGGNHLVDVPYCFDAKAPGLVPGFRTLHPAVLQQMLVQPLEVHRRQLFQWDVPEGGPDVVLNEALVGFMG